MSLFHIFVVAFAVVLSFLSQIKISDAADLTPEEKAQAMLDQMNITEKLVMMHGVNGVYTGNIPGNARLGIPAMKMQDGPQGFRVTTKDVGTDGSTTCWPSAMSIASSWDADLMYSWGSAMAAEFRIKGANMQLGPGIGLARVPNAGRNFEYLCGEDPVLGATLVKPVVKGIQDGGIMANAKHWVNNEIETARQTVSSNVDERTRFEIYYPPFEAAVEAGVQSVMCSYNRINDVSSCQNDETFKHLKENLGFKGWVVSDWMATYSTVGSLNAGLDVEMPLGIFYSQEQLNKALSNGNLTESRVDESVKRLLTAMYTMNTQDNYGDPLADATSPEHNTLAREIAAKSTVLLKNTDNILPLNAASLSGKCISVLGEEQTYSGQGSGHVSAGYVVWPKDGIANALKDAGVTDAQVLYFSGKDLAEAATGAAKCEYAVVVVATNSCEGIDRDNLSLNNGQDELVAAVVAANPKTIVIATIPGAVLMPWASSVPAIIVDWLPGQEYGNAVADVLFGKVNPSARLPITMPNKENEVGFSKAQFPGVRTPENPLPNAFYVEGLQVGYRWYHANQVTPLFPFGHGLSYTTFEYSNIAVQKGSSDKEFLTVSATVSNAGSTHTGAEVAQLYVTFPTLAFEPPVQLKAFVKTKALAPSESQSVTFTLRKQDLSIWDEKSHLWALVAGEFTLAIGASSSDLRLSTTHIVLNK